MIVGLIKSKWMGLLFLIVIMVVSTVDAADPENWRVWINIPQRQLHLYLNNELYQSFPVAVGKPSTPSPVGEFRVVSKVVNPTWSPEGKPPVPPGPKNPLGKYWLGLNIRGYGIHGNNASWSIGNPVSKGCFRMDNQDIQMVFQLIPKGTPVKITYNPFIGRVDPDQKAWLETYKDIYKRVECGIEAQRTLSELQWVYQPHLNGLSQLIKTNEEGVFEVPRMINLTGDLSGNDAFFWDNRIYLAMSYFSDLTEVSTISGNELFTHYIDLEDLKSSMGEGVNYNWDNDNNTLALYRLKIIIDGEELKEAIRYIKSQPYVSLQEISKEIGNYVDYDYLKYLADIGAISFYEEPDDKGVWIDCNDLPQIFIDYRVNYNKEEMVLELTHRG